MIETAKLNVLTAYDPDEAVEMLKRFPNVDGVVFDAETEGSSCTKLVEQLLQVRSDLTIVVTSPGGMALCREVPRYRDSHDPERLLNFLKALCERETKRLAERDEHLYDSQFRQDQSKAS